MRKSKKIQLFTIELTLALKSSHLLFSVSRSSSSCFILCAFFCDFFLLYSLSKAFLSFLKKVLWYYYIMVKPSFFVGHCVIVIMLISCETIILCMSLFYRDYVTTILCRSLCFRDYVAIIRGM